LIYAIIAISLYIAASVFAIIVNYRLKKKNYRGISYLECFSPAKQFSVALGMLLSWINPYHILEQLMIRMYAPYCIENCYTSQTGKCVHCGCNSNAKKWSVLERCSHTPPWWGKIIWSKKKYEKLRKEHPLDISLTVKLK
jgi:hypothetical protein